MAATLLLCNLLLALLIAGDSLASDDRGYCGEIHRSKYIYTSQDKVALAINLGRGRADLLIVDSTAGESEVYKMGPGGTLLGGSVEQLPNPAFCIQAGGTIKIANVNGDSTDDLVCQKSDGSLSAMYYGIAGFKAEQPIADGFVCGGELLIGDFDGNSADDFLCASADRTTYTAYFNLACNHHTSTASRGFSFNPYAYGLNNAFQGGLVAVDGHQFENRHCSGSLPSMKTLTGSICTASATKIIIADLNGDKASDVVCHTSASDILTILSSGRVSAAVLAASPVTATLATGCVQTTSSLLATDVDGDGDHDIACLVDSADNAANRGLRVSFATNGQLSAFGNVFTTYCPAFCGNSGSRNVRYSAGDFNGDGNDDIICRVLSSTTRTEIAQSQGPFP